MDHIINSIWRNTTYEDYIIQKGQLKTGWGTSQIWIQPKHTKIFEAKIEVVGSEGPGYKKLTKQLKIDDWNNISFMAQNRKNKSMEGYPKTTMRTDR